MVARRSRSAATRREVAALRRLCCLGLGSQTVVPELLSRLHSLVPSDRNQFFWAGPHQELVNMCGEGDDFLALAPLYLSEFHNKREREVAFTFTELMRRTKDIEVLDYYEHTVKVDKSIFERHDFYNLIVRGIGSGPALQVKLAEHGRALGSIHVTRNIGDGEFTARDRRLLRSIASFVGHAVAPGQKDEELTDSDDRGLIIVTSAGAIEYLSPQARRLLVMAQYPEFSPATASQPGPGPVLPPEVVCSCEDLVGVFEGKVPATVPCCLLRNLWGAFIFRAYWLDRQPEPSRSSFIGITVKRLEPLRLRLWRNAEQLPLSNREIAVCVLLGSGTPRAEIAERLGVSEHTAINHCRNIYAKLGVHSRGELIEKLSL